jgi:hypothetical protein
MDALTVWFPFLCLLNTPAWCTSPSHWNLDCQHRGTEVYQDDISSPPMGSVFFILDDQVKPIPMYGRDGSTRRQEYRHLNDECSCTHK